MGNFGSAAVRNQGACKDCCCRREGGRGQELLWAGKG